MTYGSSLDIGNKREQLQCLFVSPPRNRRLLLVRFTPRNTIMPSPTIEAQATKFEDRRVADDVWELLPEPNPDVELVFFHGLQMKGSNPEHSFWRTWKMRYSEDCWPEYLLPDLLYERRVSEEDIIKPRVLSVSYEGRPDLSEDGHGTERSDDYLIAESLMHQLICSGGADVGQRKGVPVFLVGHDLGGILIKVFVMHLELQKATMVDEHNRQRIHMFLENLKSVYFFDTPHSGSKALDRVAAKINDDEANQMLRFMNVLNKHISRINIEFQIYRQEETFGFTSNAVHAIEKTNEGGFENEIVVPEGSARNDVDTFYSAKANHFSICQPDGRESTSVLCLCQDIEKEVQIAKGQSPLE